MVIEDLGILKDMKTNSGQDLASLSSEKPVLLIFLRHFGCIFCREALKDIALKQDSIEARGIQSVFVHMSENDLAEQYFSTYGIKNPVHISDVACNYYAAFGLTKGNFSQLFGLKNILRGMEVTLKGTMVGLKQIGDGFQMPGIFMLINGRVADSYIHKSASDRPNYENIMDCCAA